MTLTYKQAFLAMYYYLNAEYDRTKSNDIGAMCSDLQLLGDGKPADPAAWSDWMKAVAKALKKEPSE